MKKVLLLFVVLLLLGYFIWRSIQKEHNTVQIGKAVFSVELAKTLAQREQGLGGHGPLENNQGMLFVFNGSEPTDFWMKGMTFPIDIIWIKNGKILSVKENAPAPFSPDVVSGLPVYQSPQPADYVLEVKAGTVQRYGFWVGENVEINF